MTRSLLLALLFGAGTCAAQSLAWKVPIFFDDFPDESGYPASFDAAYDPLPSQMLFSKAGTPGWIAAATLDAEDGKLPAVVKLSRVDGHTLWQWMWLHPEPGFEWSTGNRTVQATVDSAGQVFVTGWVDAADGLHSFLVKLDGASGVERWRIKRTAHTEGYAVAADRNGNLISGYIGAPDVFSPSDHFVEKRRADTGELIWSTALSGGSTLFDDFRIVLDSEGNAIMAGRYALPTRRGVRIVKLKASDGSVVWVHDSVLDDYYGEAGLLRVFPSGDVLVEDPLEGLLYLNADGSKRWSRIPEYGFGFSDFAIGPQGQIYFSGTRRLAPEYVFLGAVFGRIDPATGADIWRRHPDDETRFSGGMKIGADANGSLFAVWESMFSLVPLHMAMLDADNGLPKWTVSFGGINQDISQEVYGVVRDADGSIFVAATGDRGDDPLTSETWTLYKFTGPFSDDIFANGWDG